MIALLRVPSLRVRLIGCLALVLAFSLAVGLAVGLRTAAVLVFNELSVSLDVAGREVRNGLAAAADQATLRRRVAALDGDRHVVATLRDASGAVLARSRLRPVTDPVPGWFRRLLAPSLPPLRVQVPGGTIELRADPDNELAERWSELSDSLLQLGLFCLLAAAGVLWTTDRAVRPLRQLTGAFQRIEAGDYATQIAAGGPPEIGQLLHQFNRMATKLAGTEAHNRRLHLQLLNLQEEERAGLARDLHDEIGPCLFAVNLHAAGIGALAARGRSEEIGAEIRAIHDAVAHMQRHVKAILGQLRPANPAAHGLAPAIDGLIAFWRGRYRDIAFSADIAVPDAALDEAASDAVYRVVQESLTNAVRHGRPNRVEIAVHCDEAAGDLRVHVADDGRGGEQPDGMGFGLAGMRERVTALGGTLSVANRSGRGWLVEARLPLAGAESAETVDVAP